ncbi:MAG: carbonic anhydrase [Desulfobacteraceae bacterium 4572_35.1]|nr:MAG: carbonic anhydrase [Desulfobacteraceae bacterium 4572_35.1]
MKDIKEFITGFKRFQDQWIETDASLFNSLKHGQSPKVMLIGCSDSRVDPAIITDCAPGELFVVRNVANLVPPYERDASYHGVSAALEYAVRHLEVDDIIVMGHSNCGGIKWLMECDDYCEESSFIGKWVSVASGVKEKILQQLPDKSPALQAKACEKAVILLSLENMMSFPCIKKRVENGSLSLHGWYFNLNAGTMSAYSPKSGKFELLE